MTEAKPTPGPWEAKLSVYRDGTYNAHWSIQTVDKLPEHPWSPRVVAWMTGCLAGDIHSSRVKGATYCKECECWHFRGWREVGFDVRGDDRIEADARMIAAAPDMAAFITAFLEHVDSRPYVNWDWWRPLIAQARAAKAKAEGVEK